MGTLRSCPGCDGNKIKTELWGDWFATACQECHWQTGFHNSEEESELCWNTRASDAAIKELVDALEIRKMLILSENINIDSMVELDELMGCLIEKQKEPK